MKQNHTFSRYAIIEKTTLVCVQLHNAIKRWDAGVIFYSDVRYERHFLIGFFAISGNIKLYLCPFFIFLEEG